MKGRLSQTLGLRLRIVVAAFILPILLTQNISAQTRTPTAGPARSPTIQPTHTPSTTPSSTTTRTRRDACERVTIQCTPDEVFHFECGGAHACTSCTECTIHLRRSTCAQLNLQSTMTIQFPEDVQVGLLGLDFFRPDILIDLIPPPQPATLNNVREYCAFMHEVVHSMTPCRDMPNCVLENYAYKMSAACLERLADTVSSKPTTNGSLSDAELLILDSCRMQGRQAQMQCQSDSGNSARHCQCPGTQCETSCIDRAISCLSRYGLQDRLDLIARLQEDCIFTNCAYCNPMPEQCISTPAPTPSVAPTASIQQPFRSRQF